jgi:hypothetical protein
MAPINPSTAPINPSMAPIDASMRPNTAPLTCSTRAVSRLKARVDRHNCTFESRRLRVLAMHGRLASTHDFNPDTTLVWAAARWPQFPPADEALAARCPSSERQSLRQALAVREVPFSERGSGVRNVVDQISRRRAQRFAR